MSTNAILVGLVGLTLGVSAYVAVSLPSSATGAAGADGTSATAAITKADLDALREDLRGDIRVLSAKVDRRISSIDARVARGAPPGMSGAAEAGVEGGDTVLPGIENTPEGVEAIAEAVTKRLEERMGAKMKQMAEAAGKRRGGDGEWKPPMDDLAKELEMTAQQKEESRKVFDEGRDQVYALMKTMRLDGGSLLDDFVAELKDGDPEGATKNLFKRIFTENVPGSDRTYLSEVLAIREDVSKGLSQHLNESQMQKMRELNVDLTDVKTGYDPIGEYVQAKLQ